MMRILLVDDHPVVRHGIRTILTERLKGAVVGEAGDAASALVAGPQRANGTWWSPTSRCPGMSGLDLIKELRASAADAADAGREHAPGRRSSRAARWPPARSAT